MIASLRCIPPQTTAPNRSPFTPKNPSPGPTKLAPSVALHAQWVAISNSRSIRCFDARACFRVKDYRLSGSPHHHDADTAEFIRRFRSTCCPEASTASTLWVLWNSNRAANIAADPATAKRQIISTSTPTPTMPPADSRRTAKLLCPCCGGQLII
jgi:hypothetical protein